MVSVALANDNRHALKLLKKKYQVGTMDDVVRLLLARHESQAFHAGTRMADVEQAQQSIIAGFDDTSETIE